MIHLFCLILVKIVLSVGEGCSKLSYSCPNNAECYGFEYILNVPYTNLKKVNLGIVVLCQANVAPTYTILINNIPKLNIPSSSEIFLGDISLFLRDMLCKDTGTNSILEWKTYCSYILTVLTVYLNSVLEQQYTCTQLNNYAEYGKEISLPEENTDFSVRMYQFSTCKGISITFNSYCNPLIFELSTYGYKFEAFRDGTCLFNEMEFPSQLYIKVDNEGYIGLYLQFAPLLDPYRYDLGINELALCEAKYGAIQPIGSLTSLRTNLLTSSHTRKNIVAIGVPIALCFVVAIILALNMIK